MGVLNANKRIKKKNKTMSLIDMELSISHLFDYRRNIIVPNLSWGFSMHECDLFIVRESGYAIEVEIKRSKSDLLKDFKKGHNHEDRLNRICEFYYAIPTELYDSCKDMIPETSGIILCENVLKWDKKIKHTAKIIKKPKRIKNARKLTSDEILKVARLGALRIWSLKEKLSNLK